MAQLQIQTKTNQRTYYAVYIKQSWTGPWVLAPYFEPVSAKLAAAPGISSASLKTRYGSGKWEDFENMIDGSQMSSYRYYYVQIRIQKGGEEKNLWTGIITAEDFQLLGQNEASKITDQVIYAQGLEILLKNRLDGAWVKPVGGSEENKVWINNVPTFNQRYKFGGNVIGNRSSLRESEKLTYIFGADGETWSNYDIAEYLLAHYNYENGPEFWLAGTGEEGITAALNGLKGVYDFNQMTVFDALNKLISRARGFGWYISVAKNYEGNDDLVDVVPFSLLNEEIKLGEIIMPANSLRTSVDLWSEQRNIHTKVISNIDNTYDRIVVQGQRMKTCCSLSFDKEAETPHPSLEKGWSSGEETAYKDAAKNASGYSSMTEDEKADLNDKFRAEDKFERVFSTLRIPYNWDWIVGSGEDAKIANPWLDSTGELHTDITANYYNADKRLLASLPFEVGIDYSGATPDDNNPANSEPEFRKIFVLVKDADGHYQYCEKLSPYGAHVRPLQREAGAAIIFQAAQYLAAKNHWTSAEPGEKDDEIEDYGIDYEETIITAFLETDQIVEVLHSFNFYENQRTLTINIPDAELWYVTPGTVIGIDEEGALIQYGGTSSILRDDRERLKAALAAAMAWYGKERNRINITLSEIDPAIPIGTLIESVDIADIGAIGSVVTELQWNFQKGAVSTSIMTDYGELDIAGIFRR